MDFMFEDEVDEVGSDVEAYCPKCKADTTHVVISKYEDEIRRVQCNPCGDVHSYRKPRGEVEEDVPEPIAAKKRAMMKKLTWEEFFAKHGEKDGKPYEFREHYTDNVIVTHPKFGRGFVSEVLSDSKVEITFKDGRRVLVHNRRDMPGLPLAAEGDGIPSTGAKAKAAKKAAAAAAAAAAAPPPAAVPAANAGANGSSGPASGKAEPKADGKPSAKSAAPPAATNKKTPAPTPGSGGGKVPATPAAAAAAASPAAAKAPVSAKTPPAAKAPARPVAIKPAAAKHTAKPARAVRDAGSARAATKPDKPIKAASAKKKKK